MTRFSRRLYALFVFASCISAQNRPVSGIQVQTCTIEAQINPRTQSITATAKIDFTPLDNSNEAVFELNNALTVSKAIDSGGKPLATSRNAQDFTIHVTFPNGLVKSQPSEITLTYDGKLTGNEDSPVSGIKFAALHPDFGYLLYPARWFPVSGYTTNRFSGDLRITTPAGYRVIAGGDAEDGQRKRRRYDVLLPLRQAHISREYRHR